MSTVPPGPGPVPGAPPGAAPQLPVIPPGGPAAPLPPPRPPQAPGSGPLANIFQNVSNEMSEGWQMLDGTVRMLKLAGAHADFAERPETSAVITDAIHTLSTLVSHHQGKGRQNDAGPLSSSPDTADLPDDGGDNGDSSAAFDSADAGTVPEA